MRVTGYIFGTLGMFGLVTWITHYLGYTGPESAGLGAGTAAFVSGLILYYWGKEYRPND